MSDYIIRNVHIADGTGRPVFCGEVGVTGAVIDHVSASCDAAVPNADTRVLDGQGMLLMPGVIDVHCHSEGIVFHPQKNPRRVMNGITTEIAGNCGTSAAPVRPESLHLLKQYTKATYNGIDLPWSWQSFGEYLQAVKAVKPVLNFGSFVGHGTLRIAVMGFSADKPSPSQMQEMKELLRLSLRQGAVGLSAGLIYPPGVFAGTQELMELARVVKEEDKIMAVHMRNESDEVVASVEEMIRIAKETGVRMQISHHKVAGRKNAGKSDITLQMIDACRQAGYDIGLDAYPYTSGCTQLSAILPPWVHEGGTVKLLERLRDQETYDRILAQILADDGSFENMAASTTWDKIIISSSKTGRYNGKAMDEIAAARQQEPLRCALALLQEEDGEIMMIIDCMAEHDVEQILQYPATLIITDGVPTMEPFTHPRYLGSYFRVLAYYCRERKLFSLEQAVAKMTYLPAVRFGLKDRGCIQSGKKADLLLLDWAHLSEETDYRSPQKVNSAVRCVWLNGQEVVQDGRYLDVCAGELL